MLLRGMHDHGCDDIFIIVTDMKRAEMDAATEYFKFVCQYTFGQTVKHNTEREMHYRRKRDNARLSPPDSSSSLTTHLVRPPRATYMPPI